MRCGCCDLAATSAFVTSPCFPRRDSGDCHNTSGVSPAPPPHEPCALCLMRACYVSTPNLYFGIHRRISKSANSASVSLRVCTAKIFASDHVHLSAEHRVFLKSQTQQKYEETGFGGLPYVPPMFRAGWYAYIGVKP